MVTVKARGILNVKRSRRGKLVIHLYYNQLNNVRQIAQEGGMSLRFTAILKKKEEATVNHG